MNVNETPTFVGQEYYSNQNSRFAFANELKTNFEENFQPSQENGVRDAMINAAVKIGLSYGLPGHWITGVALDAGSIAKAMQKRVEDIKCPAPAIDTELFHAMMMMPQCHESKEMILMGLKGIEIPSKLFNRVKAVISQYIIGQADRAGITEKNIKQIAAIAQRIITTTAPEKAKKIYNKWVESPLEKTYVPNIKPIKEEDLKKFSEQVLQYLSAEGREAKRRYNHLESEFSQVFENQKEIFEDLKDAHNFFETSKQQEAEQFQKEEYQRKIDRWSSIFSNLSQCGIHLKMPVLCDIAVMGNIGLSTSTAISSLAALKSSASILEFAAPCFTLASAVISAISLFCQDEDEGNNDQYSQMLIQYFTSISQQIHTLRHEMHSRFDEVDKKLSAIHSTLEKGITILRKDVNNLAVPTLTSLQDIRTSLFSLYRTVNFKLDETLLHDFEEAIDKVDNYVNRIQNTVPDEQEYAQTLRLLEKVILKQSSSPTFNGTLYSDMSSQGINKLLMTKQVGHIIGFLGLYAKEVLSIQDPSSDIYRLCNPYIWSSCVSRYLKFRKMFPELSYDEQGHKMREILKTGQNIIDYFYFMANKPELIEKSFDSYMDSVEKLKEFCNRQANRYITEHLQQNGITFQQQDFISQQFLSEYDLDTSFLLQKKVHPKNQKSESLPIELVIKNFKIPKILLLAERLGLGKIEFSYVYESKRTNANNPVVYSFQIQCDFVNDFLFSNDISHMTANIYRKSGMDGMLQAMMPTDEYSIAAAWSLATFSPQMDVPQLDAVCNGMWQRIQGPLIKMRKEFASNLLASPQNAISSQFDSLINDVECKYKLLFFMSEFTGRKLSMRTTLNKLINESKIREMIQQYSQPKSNPFYDSAYYGNSFIIENFVNKRKKLKAEITEKASEMAKQPVFIVQVKKQHERLNHFMELFLQQRVLKETMGQSGFSNEEEKVNKGKDRPEKETMDKSGTTQIRKLENHIVELKADMSEMRNAMAILQKQNELMMQLLQACAQNRKN